MPNIDQLAYDANFATGEAQARAQLEIWNLAQESGNISSSINDVYMARGAEKLEHNFAVPAINLRGLPYHSAQALFNAAKRMNVGLVLLELARSEMGYTDQPPAVYASNILAAAIKVGWNRPVFIQGDHFQSKAEKPGVAKAGEVEALSELITSAVKAGFYNIDLDASTLVDLSQPTELEQQRPNFEIAAKLAHLARDVEPEGITISLGGEIGEVGKGNSRPEELTAYMEGFNELFSDEKVGLSKISIQTGTSHGGVVAADGSLAEVAVDFDLITTMSKVAREKYGMGGAVQHGASTLPKDLFDKFPTHETLEIHLATGFQNIIMDHPLFPKDLLAEMYEYINEHHLNEKKDDQTQEQFNYKLRKKAWGPFKKKTWELSDEILRGIMETLEKEFAHYFGELGVKNSTKIVEEWIKPVRVEHTLDNYLAQKTESAEDVGELDD